MRLLILGGTIFLGRHLVSVALERGHRVTLFNRGRHNPELFPQVEKLHGDRTANLEPLRARGRAWDAVVDTCGYLPRVVRASAELLAQAVEHYTFISTLSVFQSPPPGGVDESGPLETLPPEQAEVEAVTPETYGALKALCEQAVERALPGRSLVVRPGLIVGPHDPTDRFTYWPARVARGGEVLAPGDPQRPVQFIDVRDLAEWIVRLVEARVTGTFNATGPVQSLSMGQFLDACQAVTGGEARFTWVSESLLLEQDVVPYAEMPLWVPAEAVGFDQFHIGRALAAGLTFRPLADTIRATLDWDAARPPATERRNGLAPEREAALLAAWHAHDAAPAG